MFFRGKHRLKDWFTPRNGSRTAKVGGSSLHVCLDDFIGRSIYMGCYEQQNTRFISELLSPGDTFVDVGANLGYYTALGAEKVGPQGRVYAFEPFPSNFEALRANIERNGLSNVECLPVACSDTSELEEIHQIDQALFPNRTASMAGGGGPDHHTEEVRSVTLDKFCDERRIQEIQLLKVDTDGWDHRVLAGARGLLEQHRIRHLLVELSEPMLQEMGTSSQAVLSDLEALGYAQGRIGTRLSNFLVGTSTDHYFFCRE